MIATPISKTRRERTKRRLTIRKVTALTLAGFLLGGGAVTAHDAINPAVQAEALQFGPGIGDQIGRWAGGFIHGDGTVVYCVELGKLADMTNSWPTMSAAGSLPAYNMPSILQDGQWFYNVGAGEISQGSSQYQRMSYLLAKYGQTQNNQQAAALALAIWAIRGEVGATGDYNALLQFERDVAGSAAVAQSDQMRAEATAWVNAGGGNTPPADHPVLQGSPTTPYQGTVSIQAGTTRITLENAVFDNGLNEMTWANGATSNLVLNWYGQPPADDEFGRYYRVTARGEYVYYTSTPGVIYLSPGNFTDQRTAYAAAPTQQRHTGTFDDVYIDPDTIWAPQLSTRVPSVFVKPGETFADTVTFFASTATEYGPWRVAHNSAGEQVFAPITAHGTLYGPFDRDPALNPSSTPPAGAPVVGTATVTTSPVTGPGTYDVDTDLVADEAGYYTWVWNIDWNDQRSSVTNPPNQNAPSIPVNYFFTDGFGTLNEGQIVPTTLQLSTQLDRNNLTLDNLSITDEVRARLVDGQWLRDADGNRIPATVRLTVYGVNGEVEQQSTAPADAQTIATTHVIVNAPNSPVVSDPVQISVQDFITFDGLTVQACILESDQPDHLKGFIRDTCDDYGVPAETAYFNQPEVTTQAQETAAVFSYIHDVATLSGSDVPAGSSIDFTAYLKPEVGQPKYDENWLPVLDADGNPVLWTADEVDDPAAVCEAQPVGKTDRVAVQQIGDYQSPAILARSTGTVYWVEELFVEDPDTGDDVSVHRGECGLPNETTLVDKPEVTTQAQETGALMGDIHDVAIVTGPVPTASTSVDFTVYLKPEVGQPKYDENWLPVLDADGNPVLWTAEEVDDPAAVCEAQPVGKTDRVEVTGEGEYTSPAVRAGSTGTVYWVEELFVEDPDTGDDVSLHRGECGLPNETTVVELPKVITKAVNKATVGNDIHDIAIVEGPLSERAEIAYEVTFEAYHRAEGTTTAVDESLCTADTKVWESSKPTPVTGAGEYQSEKWTVSEKHVGEILWVETLWMIETTAEGETRSELHRGACGEINEITIVKEKPELSVTGSVLVHGLLVTGVLMILAGGVLALARRRNQAFTAHTEA